MPSAVLHRWDVIPAQEVAPGVQRRYVTTSRMTVAHFNLARLLEVVGRKSCDELVLRRAVRHLVRYRDLGRVG
jgi:hypothetical protein